MSACVFFGGRLGMEGSDFFSFSPFFFPSPPPYDLIVFLRACFSLREREERKKESGGCWWMFWSEENTPPPLMSV